MVTLRRAFSDDYKLFQKMHVYQALKRIPLLRSAKATFIRTHGALYPYSFKLHGDPILQQSFIKICKAYNPTSIVETGTFLGASSGFMAELFPNIPIYSTEINPNSFKKARKNLSKYKNVTVMLGTSPKVLNALIEKKVLGERPFFFLDAHWLDDWPLEEEMEIITHTLDKAVILIDDFKVPNDNRFKFDKYGAKECSLEMIRPHMNPKRTYGLFLPNYGTEVFNPNKYYPDLTGYPYIFQNVNPLFNTLKKDQFFKKFFLDSSSEFRSLK